MAAPPRAFVTPVPDIVPLDQVNSSLRVRFLSPLTPPPLNVNLWIVMSWSRMTLPGELRTALKVKAPLPLLGNCWTAGELSQLAAEPQLPLPPRQVEVTRISPAC